MARITSRPRNLTDRQQRYVFNQHKRRPNQHYPCQVMTLTGSGQERDIKCSQIPTIINGRIDSPQMNVFSKDVKGGGKGKFSKTISDHKVLIYGDSHSRGLIRKAKRQII
jgi:hypothetical protein